MIKLLIFISVFIAGEAFAGTCSTTSRTNYTNGQVLTSTALNTDFNQLVSKSNSFDGGCVTDGSLEAAALNSTEFATVTNGIHEGCALTYSDTNTIGVGKCILSSNGNLVKTTVQTNVTWGCSGCASEASASLYYLYAKATSVGTTLDLLISSTAPGTDGFDLSAGKVLGKFYNNNANDISSASIMSWNVNKFSAPTSALNSPMDRFTFNYGTGNVNTVCSADPCFVDQSEAYVTKVSWNTTGAHTITFARTYTKIKCMASVTLAGLLPAFPATSFLVGENTNTVGLSTYQTTSPYAQSNAYGTIYCEGY